MHAMHFVFASRKQIINFMGDIHEKLAALKERASCLRLVREFFFDRDLLEVDCPAISHASSIDQHIDVMRVEMDQNRWAYLHTSPEYKIKRLLAAGIGDCYQLSHVYRSEESGKLHNPEFTMLEWYRLGWEFTLFMEETLDLIRLMLGLLPASFINYRTALKTYAGIDYLHATSSELLACIDKHGQQVSSDAQNWDKETLLQFLMSAVVEPHLGKDQLLVLHDYPASQAALARTRQNGDETVAERFEIYYQGIELANGYHELTDVNEQRQRLYKEQEARKTMGKSHLPIDDNFLAALEKGLPPCCGVAVGFDRLLMLRLGKTALTDVLPFSWEEA